MYRKMSLVVFIVSIALFLFGGTAAATASRLLDVTVVDGGVTERYKVMPMTVREFLASKEITLLEKDEINVSLDEPLEQDTKIIIKRGFYIYVSLDGFIERVRVTDKLAIGHVILEMNERKNVKFCYDGFLDTLLIEEATYHLKTERFEDIITTQEIPFETLTVETDEFPAGVSVVSQNGSAGVLETVTRVRTLGGQEVSREVVSETVTVSPLAHIISIGTHVEEPKNVVQADGETFIYIAEYDMTATAYTAASAGRSASSRYYGITATGIRAVHGVVAVDPNIIPLGTELYVEDYGFAVAADTGSSIKGSKIDLYYEDLSTARRFGRQTVKVYVISLP